MQGDTCLYVVATPIGNLSDITLRALDVLKFVDCILCEDTRQTKKLLDKYGIRNQVFSYRDQNHEKAISYVLEQLSSGRNLALVSDSGTPLISDPGYKLLFEVIKIGYKVVPIPGPSSVISALSVSGLPTDKFIFLGFLPKSDKKRMEVLKRYGFLDSTVIIFESPYRIIKLLNEILVVLGDREVCIASELTKLHEECYRGGVKDMIGKMTNIKIKGEYTVLISKML